MCVCVCVLVAQSCLTLFNPMNYSQAPLSMGFPRQEFWSGIPFPSPRDPPDPGIEPGSPKLQAGSLSSKPPGRLKNPIFWANSLSAGVDGPRIRALWEARVVGEINGAHQRTKRGGVLMAQPGCVAP